MITREVVARIDALGDLVSDLMVFARPTPPHPATFQIRPLLQEAIDAVRRDPTASDLVVSVDGPDVTLMADPQLIRASVVNLLLNAAQATDGHGRIAVTVRHTGGQCTIEVRDTGPGVPEEIRDRVFEPFFTTKARGGSLGLSIARRTAELHDGTLTLAAPAAGGANFMLTLPCPPSPGAKWGIFRSRRKSPAMTGESC